jgi:hypothetical protein
MCGSQRSCFPTSSILPCRGSTGAESGAPHLETGGEVGVVEELALQLVQSLGRKACSEGPLLQVEMHAISNVVGVPRPADRLVSASKIGQA